SPGTGTVQAVVGSVRATAQLDVGNAVPVQLEIDPPWPDPLALGTIMQLAAWSTDSAGRGASPPVPCHRPAPATTLSASGALEAADAGLSMLVAQSGPLDAVAQVEVTGAPASYLVVWPPTLSVPLGTAGQLAVERTYADGTVQDLSI